LFASLEYCGGEGRRILSGRFDPSGGSKAVSWEKFSTVLEEWVAVSSVPFPGRWEHMEPEFWVPPATFLEDKKSVS
jgi:surfactin synthase thioesterase subunit